jgi:hypothetical protein
LSAASVATPFISTPTRLIAPGCARAASGFSPDTLAVLATALEDTLRHLRLVNRNDPAVTMMAKRIIELARKGECDPIQLRDKTIQSFR